MRRMLDRQMARLPVLLAVKVADYEECFAAIRSYAAKRGESLVLRPNVRFMLRNAAGMLVDAGAIEHHHGFRDYLLVEISNDVKARHAGVRVLKVEDNDSSSSDSEDDD
jgi:hypothetical protein